MKNPESKIKHQALSIKHQASRILLLTSCLLFLTFCLLLPRYAWADDNVVMEIKDDLTVLGTSGIDTDADVEIKGYTVMEGNLDLNLDALTEGFTLDKALTAGAAYTDNEFVLTREIIGGAWNLSGDLLRIWDKSATTGTNTANLLNLGTGGTFSSMFKVEQDGSLALASDATTQLGGLTYTWPTAALIDNYVLATNGTGGTLEWINVSGAAGAIDGSGDTNRIAVWSDTDTLASDIDFTWDNTGNTLTLGDTALSPSGSNVLSLATGDSFNIVSGNLQAGGNNVITPDPYLRVGDGAAVTPSVSFLNDTNSGMYSLGADKLGIITNGTATQGITIDATGQVGIGVVDPDEQLELTGRVHLGQTTAPGTTTDKLYNVGGSLYWNGTDVTGTGTVISGTDNYLARFNAAGDNVENSGLVDESDAVAITIDSSERVGIGTTGPDEQLELTGRVHLGQTTAPGTTTDKLYNVGGSLYWDGTDVGTVISGTDNYLARFNAAGDNVENSGLVDESDAVAVTIDSSERVGVGTAGPEYKLQVEGDIKTNALIIQGNEYAKIDYNSSGGYLAVNTSAPSTKDQYQEYDYSWSPGINKWQSFTSGVTGALDKIEVYNDDNESGVDFYIREGEGPSGTILASETNLSWEWALEWVTIDFVPEPFLQQGQKYTIHAIGADDGNLNWSFSDMNEYLNGRGDDNPDMDYCFRTYMREPPLDGPLYITNTGNVGIGVTSPNATLQLNGSFSVKRTATAVDYAIVDEVIIGVTYRFDEMMISLPSANGAAGRIVIIKDESGQASFHPMLIEPQGTETIDGQPNAGINWDYGKIKLYSDGSNWFTM